MQCYGSRKDGIAYTYKGQRAGRPHVATWAEAGMVTAADLLAGDEDPRPGAGGLIERSMATLRAAGVTARPRVRGDVGYFAKDIAWAAVEAGCDFSLGITRNPAAWRAAAAIADDAWTAAVGMKGAQVAVADYAPAGWPPDTACLVRRVRVAAADVSTDPRARRRRTIPKDQLALALQGLVEHVYAYSFIATNADVSTPAKAAAAEAWHRMRTDIEDRIRDAKHGAALRHLPSGNRVVSRVAATHCCAAAPSEPCMRLINAHGSSKPLGRCGLKCWLPTLAGLYPASAGGVYQAGSSVVRRADPVLVDEVLDGYRLAGDAQPPAFPVAWRLRRLVLGEQVVPTQWAATALPGEQAKVVAVQWGFDPSPSGSPVVGQVGVVGGGFEGGVDGGGGLVVLAVSLPRPAQADDGRDGVLRVLGELFVEGAGLGGVALEPALAGGRRAGGVGACRTAASGDQDQAGAPSHRGQSCRDVAETLSG